MKELIGISKLNVKEKHTMTTMDATRIKKNFSYIGPQLELWHTPDLSADNKT
jgi:hypothetical protein